MNHRDRIRHHMQTYGQPGTALAREHGCTCSDDQPTAGGNVHWANEDCPVHGYETIASLNPDGGASA